MKNLSSRFNLSTVVSVVTLCTLFSATAFSSTAHAKYIHNEKSLIKVCEAIQTNSPSQLRSAVKRSGHNYQALADGLLCNGQTVIEFAMANGAAKNASLFSRHTHTKLPELVAKAN
jgi:hypothetical protein